MSKEFKGKYTRHSQLRQGIRDRASCRHTENFGKKEVQEEDTWENKGTEMFLYILGYVEGQVHAQG